ncbi:MAG TPA: peptide deformylase [Candidatus Paceibacterota bacterium]
MREIVQDGAPVLREVAKPVPEKLFGSTELTEFVADMAAVLDQEPDGVALAAPQVGVSWRLFIVRMDRVETPPLHDGAAEGEAVPARPAAVEVYVNPEIIKTSRKRAKADEGCLSVRNIYGGTNRHERVTIAARRPDGSHLTRGGGGLLAQIFEHEIDHLNGILFTDSAEDLVEIKPLHHEPIG